MPTKTATFDSIFKMDYAVVEERRENLQLYPHTEQLPVIFKALELEFKTKLPDRIARVDRRANDFDKIVLWYSALAFCHLINNSRPDQLQLYPLCDRNLVCRLSVVQQIQEHAPGGLTRRFKFYAGDDFFPEIMLSGKRLVFTDHAIKQFLKRAPAILGQGLNSFMMSFFNGRYLALPCNGWFAFVFQYDDSIIALPFDEVGGDYVILTCLGLNEINSLGVEIPVHAFNLHYDLPFTLPQRRHWIPIMDMMTLYERWERKAVYTRAIPSPANSNWYELAQRMKDLVQQQGHGPGSRLCFLDHVPSPSTVMLKPGENEGLYNELEILTQRYSDRDWPAIFAELYSRRYSKADA